MEKKLFSTSFFFHSLGIILESQCPFLIIDMQMEQCLFIFKEDQQQIFFIRASFITVKFCTLLYVFHLLLLEDKKYAVLV